MTTNISVRRRCFAILALLVVLSISLLLRMHSAGVWENIQFKSHIPAIQSNKPHIVFGILSADQDFELRDAQRNTWLSTLKLMQENIPFRFTYKFLFDFPTPKIIEENKLHNDILFLNVSHIGYAFRYGEKLYVWMNYIYNNYPDTLLAAKMDNDVFLCVPHVFHKLNSLKSSKLYYGWAHGSGPNISISRRVDEMFVVFGMDIIKRIVKRQYCNDSKVCDVKKQLIDTNYADESLALWISIYKDIDFRPDNSKIIHSVDKKWQQQFIRKEFCDKHLLFHKTTPDEMRKLHSFNTETPIGPSVPGSVTGKLFSGNVTRGLPPAEVPSQSFAPTRTDTQMCAHWAVVTTIFPPSEALFHIIGKSGWCVVIVADVKTPEKKVYMEDIKSKTTIYLSLKDQDTLYPYVSKLIPRNHFGRKNIGYLYAIQHNGTVIWDFDDDNIGMADMRSLSKFNSPCKEFKSVVLNPYPYFGVNETYVWPRGVPLQFVKDRNTVPKMCDLNNTAHVGVVQSLANEQPDVDAIFRLTRTIPFNFTARVNTHKSLLVPTGVYAPFNSQATLWMQPAFTLLALPLSVNGRVSDIWRAYIAQYFMHKKNLHLVFSIPFVRQKRNEHNIMKDFNAERDLYEKSNQLLNLLSSIKLSPNATLVNLYEELYKREYIEAHDLLFIKAWMKTLQEIRKK